MWFKGKLAGRTTSKGIGLSSLEPGLIRLSGLLEFLWNNSLWGLSIFHAWGMNNSHTVNEYRFFESKVSEKVSHCVCLSYDCSRNETDPGKLKHPLKCRRISSNHITQHFCLSLFKGYLSRHYLWKQTCADNHHTENYYLEWQRGFLWKHPTHTTRSS